MYACITNAAVSSCHALPLTDDSPAPFVPRPPSVRVMKPTLHPQSVIRLQLYARIRRIRFKQIFERLEKAGIQFEPANIQPICENLLQGTWAV